MIKKIKLILFIMFFGILPLLVSCAKNTELDDIINEYCKTSKTVRIISRTKIVTVHAPNEVIIACTRDNAPINILELEVENES